MAFDIDPYGTGEVAIIRYRGDVTTEEIHAVLTKLGDLAARGHPLHLLADFIDAKLAISYEEVLGISRRTDAFEQKAQGARWALVASDDLTFGLLRMYEGIANHQRINVSVFRSKAQALQWLLAGQQPTGRAGKPAA